MAASKGRQQRGRERFTVPELAKYLQITIDAVYIGLRRGQIPSRKVGRRWIIVRRAISEWQKCGVRS